MKLKKLAENIIREYLNEQQNIENNLNDNFWKWFGNSRTVDKNGNLELFRHTTNVDISTFDKSKLGKNGISYGIGFYFEKLTNKITTFGHLGNIKKDCFLKIEKPYISKGHLYENFFIKETSNDEKYQIYNMTNSLKKMYKDNYWDNSNENDLDKKIFETHDYLTKVLIKYNYDGIIGDKNITVVFNPNQIKSVENKGTWDLNDNDIYS
jgi:hypothetical protein